MLRAPLRNAASTTTVPQVIVAIIRLRFRNRFRSEAEPGGTSLSTTPEPAIWASRRRVLARIGPVDPSGEHRDGPALGGQGGGMGGRVYAVRRARDDREAALHHAVGQLRGVSRPYGVEAREPTMDTERSQARSICSGPCTHRQNGGSASTAKPLGHSSSPGTDQPATEPAQQVERRPRVELDSRPR